MSVLDRVIVGVDRTDFGFEALRQTLALISPGGAVYAVTALDTSIAVHAGYSMRHVSDQLEEEAEKARAAAAEILNDRPNCTAKLAEAMQRRCCGRPVASTTRLCLRSAVAAAAASSASSPVRRRLCFSTRQHNQCCWPACNGVSAGSRSGSWLASMVRSRPSPLFRWRTTSKLGSARRYRSWRLRRQDRRSRRRMGRARHRVGPGAPVRRITRSLEICDLVILGSRGLHGVQALGSVSERVAHRAHCSTLVTHLQAP